MCTNLVFGLRVEDDSYCRLADSAQHILTITYDLAAIGMAAYAFTRPARQCFAFLAAACVAVLMAPFALEATMLIFVAGCGAGIVFVLCMPAMEPPQPVSDAIGQTRIDPDDTPYKSIHPYPPSSQCC